MPKPSDLPNWSTDANYPAGAEPEAGTPTKVEPITAKQEVGFRPEEKPKAQTLNWWQNLVYQWIAWLDAGVWEAVSLDLTGGLTVDGDVISSAGGASFATSISAGGDISSSNGLVYYGGTEKQIMPLTDAFQSVVNHLVSVEQILLAASATAIHLPIRVPEGALILGYTIQMAKNTSGSATVEIELTDTHLGATSGNGDFNVPVEDDSPGEIVVESPEGIEQAVVGGHAYHLKITASGSVAPDSDRIHSVTIHWSKPSP